MHKLKYYIAAATVGTFGIIPFKILAYLFAIVSASFLFTLISLIKLNKKLSPVQYLLFLSKLLLYAVLLPAVYVLCMEMGLPEIWGFFIAAIFVHELIELLNSAQNAGIVGPKFVEKVKSFIKRLFNYDSNGQ